MVISTTPNFALMKDHDEDIDSVEKLMNNQLLIAREERAKYASDTSTISTFESEEYKRLHDILSSPEQLAYFQTYLQGIHAHENLLFIEALAELRHEKSAKGVESIVHRIWTTFFAADAPLELNVQSKEEIGSYILLHKWGFITKSQALDLFRCAETEVKIFLNEKINEFDNIIYRQSKITFHEPTCSKHQKRVVIIGGGFAGFTVASILDPMPRFHVTLIDTKDSFEYTPGMIKLLVRPEETSSLRVRHDAYVKNGRVVIGYAEQIVENASSVKVNNEYIPADYIVIATGSTYMSKLKSFDTSSLYRLSELSKEHNELKKAKSILIIGGGLVGCELASEIAQHTYPPPYDQKKKITIVDSHSHLVRRSSVKRQTNAMNYLANLGVQIVLNEKIVDFDSGDTNTYLGSSGNSYSGYDKVFLATGTTPCSGILQGDGDVGFESCVDHWGRIKVKPTLQLDHWKYKHIYAGGDVTNVMEEKTGYAGTLAGVCIARNICRMEKGKEPLNQGSKGTLPAPLKPLHGIESQGGVGRKSLGSFKKTFAFLNPSWAALKYFDEKEFLNIVQGETSLATSNAIGKKPRVLELPETYYKDFIITGNSSSSIRSASSSIYLQQQQTNDHHYNPNTKKTSTPSTTTPPDTLLPSPSSSENILRVSATNLSGSDIITTNNHNELSFSTTVQDPCLCSYSNLKNTKVTCHTPSSASTEDLTWLSKSSSSNGNGVLWPRPSFLSSKSNRSSTSNYFLSRKSNNDLNHVENVDTEKRLYHRKINSQ